MNSVSVIVTTTRKRYGCIENVMDAWAKQDHAMMKEFWLLDADGDAPEHPTFDVWRCPVDCGTHMDYAFSLMASGDLVLLADDDFLPGPTFTSELLEGFYLSGADISGVIGRTFDSDYYYDGTTYYRSDKVESAVRVGFCGVAFLARRSLFGFSSLHIHNNLDDLWLQMVQHPTAKKFVVPTKAYTDLPESRSGMFANKEAREIRQGAYKRWYDLYYKPRGVTV